MAIECGVGATVENDWKFISEHLLLRGHVAEFEFQSLNQARFVEAGYGGCGVFILLPQFVTYFDAIVIILNVFFLALPDSRHSCFRCATIDNGHEFSQSQAQHLVQGKHLDCRDQNVVGPHTIYSGCREPRVYQLFQLWESKLDLEVVKYTLGRVLVRDGPTFL